MISPIAMEAPTKFDIHPSLPAEFRLSLENYLNNSGLEGVIVGAYVFDEAGRLLIVQRAKNDSMPLLWEIPGGGVENKDESLLHAAVRELWEESGLRAHHVHQLVGEGYEFLSRRDRKSYCRYCFTIHVDGYDVKLKPDEHQAYLWVTEEEAMAKKCGDVKFAYTTRNQEEYIPTAFKLYMDYKLYREEEKKRAA
jgi:8-oxo-dGTP pyrophosphatase MutT (NUDIX family)